MGIGFRNLLLSDSSWLTEVVNDPDAAKYMLSVYPISEHDVVEILKKDLESTEAKTIVAELDGEPAGAVSLWWRPDGRDRHIAWLGIDVRTKHWGKGIGSALMREAVRTAKEMGFRKIVLGVFKDNTRAMRLYEKSGFEMEAREKTEVWIDGSWRTGFIMGRELAPCRPKLKQSHLKDSNKEQTSISDVKTSIRQLNDLDLDELNRLQNSRQSTKSSFRIPPFTKEQTKRWYEGIKSQENKYCLADFNDDKLLGYILFKATSAPFFCLRFEEILVDMDRNPCHTASALVKATIDFKERYGYHRISLLVPENSYPIISALESQGFKKGGAVKDYYFIDDHYTNAAMYEHCNKTKPVRTKPRAFPITTQGTRALSLKSLNP